MTMTDSDTPRDRRSFLSTIAAGGASLAAGSLAMHAMAHDAFAEPGELSGDFSEEWLTRLTGQHKQFFDCTSYNGGFGLAFAMNFFNSYNEAYKLPDSQLSVVVGLRHSAIAMAFTDDIWNRYKLGEAYQINDPSTRAPALRNIFFHSHDGDVIAPGLAIDKLLARGAQVTCCALAMGRASARGAAVAGVTADVAKQEWTAGMIPGVVLVPSGVLAVNRAQEKGCTYCYGG